MKVSIVIPHKNRRGMLAFHLGVLMNNQTYRNYEIIVVDDHSEDDIIVPAGVRLVKNTGRGPAAARNTGANLATGDIILFVGDDCIPGSGLVMSHVAAHTFPCDAVQGYSPFHPEVMGSEFMEWLDGTGLQANWSGLFREDGAFARDIDGYCLTTNYSIKREAWEKSGGFNEAFPQPAWEDVAFGHMNSTLGMKTIFEPAAINFHYHLHTPDSFIGRQNMVGKNALIMGSIIPAVYPSLVQKGELAAARAQDLGMWQEAERKVRYAPSEVEGVANAKRDVWARVTRLAFLKGMLEVMDREPVLGYLEFAKDAKSAVQAITAHAALRDGNFGYAAHVAGWVVTSHGDAPESHMLAVILLRAIGDESWHRHIAKAETGAAENDWIARNLPK